MHSPTKDGAGVHVVRARGDVIEAGEMRPIKDGQPIVGELVRLSPRPELPNLFEAETLHEAPKPSGDGEPRGAGPAQVASDKYRKNWDAIWRRGRKPPSMLN
jgi:hypothetical protein